MYSKIETIHSVPDMVDWVGCYREETLIRIAPVFADNLSDASIGAILLVDLARDVSLATNYSAGRLSVGNIDNIGSHIATHFGQTTYKDLNSLVGRPLGVSHSRLIAQHMVKVLGVNNPNQAPHIEQDKSRIRLRGRHLIGKIDPASRLLNLSDLANWLGRTYGDLDLTLLRYKLAE